MGKSKLELSVRLQDAINLISHLDVSETQRFEILKDGEHDLRYWMSLGYTSAYSGVLEALRCYCPEFFESSFDSSLESGPASAFELAPDSALESALDSALESAPDSALESAPDSSLESAPDSALESFFDSLSESAPDSDLYLPHDFSDLYLNEDTGRYEIAGNPLVVGSLVLASVIGWKELLPCRVSYQATLNPYSPLYGFYLQVDKYDLQVPMGDIRSAILV